MDSQLAAEIRQLHAELQRTPTLDAQSREQLETLVRDINAVLAVPQDSQLPATDNQALLNQLDTAAVRFQIDHPGLSSTLQRLIDALAKAGL